MFTFHIAVLFYIILNKLEQKQRNMIQRAEAFYMTAVLETGLVCLLKIFAHKPNQIVFKCINILSNWFWALFLTASTLDCEHSCNLLKTFLHLLMIILGSSSICNELDSSRVLLTTVDHMSIYTLKEIQSNVFLNTAKSGKWQPSSKQFRLCLPPYLVSSSWANWKNLILNLKMPQS